MINIQQIYESLDLLSADVRISDNSYQWLINARTRFGYVEPIQGHIDLTANAPIGLFQALYAVGDTLLLFVSGNAYYLSNGATYWQQIIQFIMSPTAPQYWVQSVPASTVSFVRKAGLSANDPVALTTDFKISGTPFCVVVQDGINQPFVIQFDTTTQTFTARATQTYTQWNNQNGSYNNQEYVPIGTLMMYMDTQLYIVAPDFQSVYRSISGRPLDFMVVVDTNGNKLASESAGGATRVSFAFDYDKITCLKSINVASSFMYGTEKNIRIGTADYTNTLFGEPTYYVSGIINTGVVNQFCVAEVLGDYVFTDKEGAKSFNAVQQIKFRGRNSPFSLAISKLFRLNKKSIKQVNPVVVYFDNYAIFSLNTKYGVIQCIYDALKSEWVAFDVNNVVNISQFAIVETVNESILYCITAGNKIFKMFYDTASYVTTLKTKAYTGTGNDRPNKITSQIAVAPSSIDHKGARMTMIFDAGTYDGTVTLIEYVDGQVSPLNKETKPIAANLGGIKYPVFPPVGPCSTQTTQSITFTLTQGLTGRKITYVIIWNTDHKLVEHEINTSEVQDNTSSSQKQLTYNNTYGSNS